MKKTDLKHRTEQHQSYAEHVAALQRESRPVRPKPVQPEGMSREEWIESMQPKSTQALIAKHKDPSYVADNSRPLPDAAIANPNAKSLDELVAVRQLDPIQVSHVEATRRRPKNSIGQSPKSATTKEKRESAIHHFEVSGHAIIKPEDVDRVIKKLEPIVNVAQSEPVEVWKPLTFWQAVKHWLQGGKVKRSEEQPNQWGAWRNNEEE
jgi:hypothetical protein